MKYTLKQIADKLGVTKPTVLNHIHRIEKSRGQILYNRKNTNRKIVLDDNTYNLVLNSFIPKAKRSNGLLLASYNSRIYDLKQENHRLYSIIQQLNKQVAKAQDLQHTAELQYSKKSIWTKIKNFFK